MAHETGRPDHLVDGLRDQPGQGLDGPVPTDEPVIVVVGLEVVEVRIEEREGLILANPAADLLLHADVAGQPGQWRERSHLPSPPQRPFHASQEFDRVERLDDVVVRPRRKPQDLVGGEGLRGQHDDAGGRRSRITTQALGHLEPIELRHHHVEEDQVRTELDGLVEPLLAVRGHGHLVTSRPKVHLDEPRYIRIVVDHEDGFGHGLTSPSGRRDGGPPAPGLSP